MADILLNVIQSQAVGITDDQADIQQSLEGLIQEHLEQVLDTLQLPNPDKPMGLDICRLMAQVASEALRQDGDVLAAELLQAALRISHTSPESDAEHVNDFLQRTIGVMAGRGESNANAFRAYLENTLLDLSRQRWYSLEPPMSPTGSADSLSLTTATGPCLTLYIGESTMPLLLGDILSTFWAPGPLLNTACHHCQQPIVDEPPIRTIARVDPGSTTALGTHVRVNNRHFSCLKEKDSLWIPVSHVWDDSIRKANELKIHDDEAASTMVRTLTALLDASMDAYGPNVEFWHDYFSVPQWEERTKESLLMQIPTIYHGAEEILVRMSDLPGSHIMMLLSQGNREFSASMALRLMPVLHALCSSQWMDRMWVLLEYSLCRSACVMDESDYIWRSTNGPGLLNRDTFTKLVRHGAEVLLGLFRHAKNFASSLKDCFLTGLTNKDGDEQRDLSLGETLELISRTKCQYFRDRFLAVHMVVNKNSPPNSPAIPADATDACRWVWCSALLSQDFSPLLLQPHESQLTSNPPDDLPSWLTGYSGLDHAEWGLGNKQQASQVIISLEDGSIKTELDVVGKIERIHYLDTEESGEVSGVEWAVGILGSLANTRAGRTTLSAAELVDGLNRIFPFDSIHTRYAQQQAGVVYTLEGRQSLDRRFKSTVETYIAEYFAAPSGCAQRRYVAHKLSQLLKYDTHIMGNLSAEVTRLTKSRHIARSRRQRGCVNGEPICEVRCLESECRAVTVFRLDLRANGKVGDMVYRIPGLSYSETVENGVGVVLSGEGRITGRMLYGPPRCPCQSRQKVEIR